MYIFRQCGPGAATVRNASRYHHRQKPGQYQRCEGNGREPSHRSFSDNNDFESGDVPNLLVWRRPIDLHNLAARVIVPQLKLCAACNEPESAHPNGHEFKRLPEWRGFYALRRGIGTALADVDSAVAAKSVLRHANVQTTTAH